MQTSNSQKKAIVGFLQIPWLLGLLLFIATLIAYLPAWHAGFIWDDDDYVTNNPLLIAPDGLRRIWFSTDSPSQYFPLVYTIFRFEHALWGFNSTGYHCVNILLHATNALLVWQLLKRVGIPGAWLAAAIFALHPVNVESVAWVTELKSVLSLFFVLLSLLAWVEVVEQLKSRRWYGLALLFYLFALFSKTTACTLPVALLLIVWLKHKPISRHRLLQVIPFVVFGIGMGLLTIWWERYHIGTQGKMFAMGLPERVLVASHAVWFYLGKLLWPANLIFSYPRWSINPADPFAYGWLMAGIVLCVVIYLARKLIGRSVEIAALFYVATLSPMLGFVMLYTFHYTFVADHYQYVACLGPITLVAAGIVTGFQRLRMGKRWLKPLFCGILLMVLGMLTFRQCKIYSDIETLWQVTIERNPGSWMAHDNLGYAFLKKGRIIEADAQFHLALKIWPDDPEAHYNLGITLLREGYADEAISQFMTALTLQPNYAEAENNLGDALLQKGQADDAIAHYRKALQIKPGYAEAHYNLGIVLLQKEQVDEAISQFQKAASIQPNYTEAIYNLGFTLLQKGQADEAIIQFKKALTIQPNLAEARYNFGVALFQKGQTDDAIIQFQKAIAIRPDLAEAHNNLGYCLFLKDRIDEAILQLRTALIIQPDSAVAQNVLTHIAWLLATSPNPSLRNGTKAVDLSRQMDQLAHGNNPTVAAALAAAYAETGQFSEAITTLQRASQLATVQNKADLVAALQVQLKYYQAGLPFRDNNPR